MIHRFLVSRETIARSSKYFEVLFGPDFKEGTEEEIILKNIDGPTLKAVIEFIHTGGIELTADNIESILAAASGMEILSLEQKCDQYLQSSLSTENCMETLVLADRYCFKELRKNALEMVSAKYEEIPTADILLINASLFGELLKSDRIKAPETVIFNSLLEWANEGGIERASCLPELLKLIRLEFIPGEVISKQITKFKSDQ